MAKRDIVNAIKRIASRPDLVYIFTTDITGKASGREVDISFGHLAVPFVWDSSPAYNKLHTDAITAIRNFFRQTASSMGGMERFSSFIYVVYCMLVEWPVGQRLNACSSCRKWSGQQIPDDDPVKSEKKELDGQRSQQNTLFGFGVNTDVATVRLPEENPNKRAPLYYARNCHPEIMELRRRRCNIRDDCVCDGSLVTSIGFVRTDPSTFYSLILGESGRWRSADVIFRRGDDQALRRIGRFTGSGI